MWQWGIDSIAGKDVDGDICFVDYPAITAKWYKTHIKATDKPSEQVKPATPTVKTYKAGEAVQLSNTALYGSSTTSQPANHLTGTYYIHTADDVLNGRIRITTPKGCSAVTGWVKVIDIGGKTAESKPAAEIRKGDRVQIKQGATWYGETNPLKDWLFEKIWIVTEVVGNRAVLGKDTNDIFDIQSPIDIKYLIKK
jgi:lyzozyme M1 (1,4-beta-N-acetylmuramidase)